MTESVLSDSINSSQSRFCSNHQPEDCWKGDNVKIFCLKDRRWKRIKLTNNRIKRYDKTGRWYNYWALNPLPDEKKTGSVDLSPGTRWVIYDPAVSMGTTNPFDDDCEDAAEHATTQR